MNKSLRLLLFGAAFFAAAGFAAAKIPDDMQVVLKQRCAECHKGRNPPRGLSLEAGKSEAAVDARSVEVPSLKIIDPGNPESSYLLKKVRGDRDISGGRMPLGRKPLADSEIEVIKSGILSITEEPGTAQGSEPSEEASPGRYEKPAFWGTRLINLPTTTTMDRHDVLFRVSHRFIPKTDSGYDSFYGLDGPAFVYLSLGYGISDHLGVTLGRSNLFQEWDLSADWLLAEEGKGGGLPFSAAVHGGIAWASQTVEGRKRLNAHNFMYDVELSLSRQVTRRWSLLVVPAYSTNTNHLEPSYRGTFALGVGTRYMILEDFSVIAEWIPVISGYKNTESGWGLGLEMKIGGHVFQAFVVNSFGLTADQFIPGGDLRLGDFDFRFGFNIFRTF